MNEIKNKVNVCFMNYYEKYENEAINNTLSYLFQFLDNMDHLSPMQIIEFYELIRKRQMKKVYDDLYNEIILKECIYKEA
ncbi:hypothetical protein [Virgibacillus halodenitrificans]|uniref:hypothetical protein n=1 Tax=Virgibacillus halodenitrificans TaxID=1482 RepID=UPI000EF49823|nr:hypothetical protein [Virgibacillus halodenitrificans]